MNDFKYGIKMLLNKRIDFLIGKESLILDKCHKYHLKCRDIIHIEANLNIPDNQLYIALNKKTNPILRKTFVTAFELFKRTKEFKLILTKYSLEKIKDNKLTKK